MTTKLIETPSGKIIIRPETKADYDAILRLTYQAFLTVDFPGRRRMDEHYLIYLLQDCPQVIHELCFVAELDGEIVGHILYTHSHFTRTNGTRANTITFGPLSVLPKYHNQGIGKSLVYHTLELEKKMGYGAVLITGVPSYYPKLGFKLGSDYGLTIPDNPMPEAFLVYELAPGYLSGGGVWSEMLPEFTQAEEDDAGYEAFHKQFLIEHGGLLL